jgi:hypothetical protein
MSEIVDKFYGFRRELRMKSTKELIESGISEKTIRLRNSLNNHFYSFGLKPALLSLRKILLENYYILVIGDSVAWGQGLEEKDKFHSLVEKDIREKYSGANVYKKVLAHSGATIGIGDFAIEAPLYGEVPTSHPSILQQCDAFTGLKKTIDLILVNGDINDINVRTILNPLLSNTDLSNLINRHCYQDMKIPLTKIGSSHSNAKVVVSGYYQLVSDDSDLFLLG